MKIWIAVFALAISAQAQTARVVALSPIEAQEAKSLHDQQKAIADKIVVFDQEIRAKYLSASKDEEGHTNTYSLAGSKWIWVKQGWGAGDFEYSTDFKFIVPSLYQQPKPQISCCSGIASPYCSTFTVGPTSGSLLNNSAN